jgi:hypothetical protein
VLLLKILVLVGLLVIFIQDIKSRAVYWVVFPILAISLIVLQYKTSNGLNEIWQPAIINVGFLLLQLLLLSVYFSVKNKRFINIADGLLGLGDILFLLSITVYLSVLNFLFFYLVSLVLVLLAWIMGQSIFGKKNKHIPLAGMQSMVFIVFLSCDWLLKIVDLTDDTWLINFIVK